MLTACLIKRKLVAPYEPWAQTAVNGKHNEERGLGRMGFQSRCWYRYRKGLKPLCLQGAIKRLLIKSAHIFYDPAAFNVDPKGVSCQKDEKN